MRLLPGLLCLLATVACSDDTKVRHLPDAPPPPLDALDASTAGPVTLTITEGGTPIPGVEVIFQDADSTVVLETTTGTNGVASATMDAGGYVTAIQPFLNTPQGIAQADLRTFVGVKPGDQLQLRQPGEQPGVNVTFAGPMDPNAFSYFLYTSCGAQDISGPNGSGSAPGGPVTLFGCGPMIDVILETRDFSGAKLRQIVEQNIPVTEGTTIDLTARTYTPVPAATFSYANLPATVTSVGVSHHLVTPRGPLLAVFTTQDVVAGAASASIERPTVTGATMVTTSELLGSSSTRHTVVEWGPASDAYSFDGAGALLPELTSAASLSIPDHRISWTSAAGAQAADLVRLSIGLTRETPALQSWRWQIVAPAAGSAVVLPVLPGAPARFNPVAGDVPNRTQLVVAKVPGGYDAVRASVLAVDGISELAVGASGRALFATFLDSQNFLQRWQPAWPFSVLKTHHR
ncbi:MAG: hypothetical protein M3680_35475 [Myxococcota bacterium]|nr:hypothetical protein [Myxococcota bacterium]